MCLADIVVADEKPTWVANRVARFLAQDNSILAGVDLSWLEGVVTLNVGFYGTQANKALGQLLS